MLNAALGVPNRCTIYARIFSYFSIALVRHALKRTPIPYTVLLMVVGLIIGALSEIRAMSFLKEYTTLANIDPHLMLFIFLPTLIFESAFVMDVHTFRKTIGQAIVLAGPGLLLCSSLTSLMARFIFPYEWPWVACFMFGTILSATDPVAVVALLKELGASKQLGTIIEGESLLNDGAAIVLFNVFLIELQPGNSQSALEIFLYFVKVALGGPAFGYLMAKITIFWLSHVFNDALVEITITLASTYITFYIGEGLFEVSGVLAVVTLGIELNSRRTSISPEVETFLHR
jgi:sodium/hydrogen exchanger 10/11